MLVKCKMFLVYLVGVLSVASNLPAANYEWSSTMGQARALQRSVRDLCRAIERSNVPYASRSAARLGGSVNMLVDLLSQDACIEDVRDAQFEVQLWLERTAVAIEGRCDLVANPRLAIALANVASNFDRLVERINDCILPTRNVSRRPSILPVCPPPPPFRILPYPYPITGPAPIRERQPRMVIPPARNPGDWHQSNVPGYVSPGDWHHTQIPGSISPGSWHPINTP